jgi:hypothetical protein
MVGGVLFHELWKHSSSFDERKNLAHLRVIYTIVGEWGKRTHLPYNLIPV